MQMQGIVIQILEIKDQKLIKVSSSTCSTHRVSVVHPLSLLGSNRRPAREQRIYLTELMSCIHGKDPLKKNQNLNRAHTYPSELLKLTYFFSRTASIARTTRLLQELEDR